MNKTMNNKTIKRVLLGALALVLAIVTVTVSMSGIFQVQAALTINSGSSPTVYVVVPETIYLEPELTSAKKFQYYVNNSFDSSSNTVTLDKENSATQGKFYFKCADATSVSVSVSGASVTLSKYNLSNNDNGTITAGTLSNGLAQKATSQITWTFSFTYGGKNYSVNAYTTCYAPYCSAVAAGCSSGSTGDKSTYASHISWWEGVHGFTTEGMNTTELGNSATADVQKYPDSSKFIPIKNIIDTKTGSNAGYWLSDSETNLEKSCWYMQDYRDSGNTWHTVACTSPIALLTVDSSRINNLNQIPNLKAGMRITDLDGAGQRRSYKVWLYSGTMFYYGYKTNDDTHTDVTLQGKNDVSHTLLKQAYENDGDRDTTNTTNAGDYNTCGTKYHECPSFAVGSNNSSISLKSTVNSSVHWTIKVLITYNRYEWASSVSYCKLSITSVNKSGLRASIDNAKKAGYNSNFYSSSSWSTFETALKNASNILGKPDATQDQINNAKSTLDSAVSGLTKNTSTAYAKYYNDETGDLIDGSIKETDTKGYTYGDTVIATKEDIPGFDYTGVYEVKDSNGDSYSSCVTANSDKTQITISKVSCAGLTVIFHYKPKSSNVIFNGNKPDNASSSVYNVNATIDHKNGSVMQNVSVPTLTGWSFQGYFDSDGKQYYGSDGKACNNNQVWDKDESLSDGKRTLYARWSANTYSVVYNGNGSTEGSTTTSTHHTYDTASNLTSNGFARKYTVTFKTAGDTNYPASEGNSTKTATYEFQGWATTSGGSVAYSNGASVSTLTTNSYTTLYAKWKSVSVTFPSVTRKGYNFAGWKVESGSTSELAEGLTFAVGTTSCTPTSNVTLTAQWTAKKYDLVINGNGGKISGKDSYSVLKTASPSVMSGSSNYGTLDTWLTKERTGYTFAGFFDASSGGTKVYNADGTSVKGGTYWASNSQYIGDKDMNLYAQWTANKITVTYNGNGETSSTTSESFTYDTAYQLTNKGFSKSYTVTYNPNGTAASPAKVKSDASNNTNVQEVKACTFNGWKVTNGLNNSTAKYGSSNNPSDALSSSDTLITKDYYVKNLNPDNNAAVTLTAQWTNNSVTLPTPSRSGYTFAGWYDGDSKVGDAGASYTVSANKTLTAHWTANTYSVRFNANGGFQYKSGTNYVDNYTQTGFTYDTAKNLDKTKFVRAGYTFAGWAESATGSVKYTDGQSVSQVTGSGTKDLYAIWNKKTFTITYDLDGGTASSNPTSYDIDTATFTINNPTKAGYEFAGWKQVYVFNGITNWNKGFINLDNGYLDYSSYSNSKFSEIYLKSGVSYTASAQEYRIRMFTSEGKYNGNTHGNSSSCNLTGSADNKYSFVMDHNGNLNGVMTITNNSAANKSFTVEKGSFGHMKLIATWTPNVYTVDYKVGEVNGTKSGSTASTHHTYDNKGRIVDGTAYTDTSLRANGFTVTNKVTYNYNNANFTKTDGTTYGTDTTTSEQKNVTWASWKRTDNGIEYTTLSQSNLTTGSGPITMNAQWTYPSFTAPAPTIDGYTFKGWYSEASCTNLVVNANSSFTPKGNKTLYAKWEAVGGYTITFDENDGTNYNLLNNSGNKTSTKDTKGGIANLGTRTVSISYTTGTNPSNGYLGKLSFSGESYSDQTYQYTTAINWNADDYVFVGQYTNTTNAAAHDNISINLDSDSSNEGYILQHKLTNDKTLVGALAYYKLSKDISYTGSTLYFRYDINTATNSNGVNQTVYVGMYHGYTGQSYDQDMETVSVPSRNEYDFLGYWTKKSDGSWGTQYYKADGTSAAKFHETGDTILYARWKKYSYNVRFNGNGGSGTMSNQEFEFDQTKALSSNAFSRKYTITYNYNDSGLVKSDGTKYVTSNTVKTAEKEYAFNGWNTKADGSGTSYTNNQSVCNLNRTKGAVYDLYAQWNVSNFNLYSDSTIENGRSGYIFDGWYDAAEGGYKVGGSGASCSRTLTGNVTYYAHWTPITYTVVYHGNGETGGTTATSTHTYNVSKNLTANDFTRSYAVNYYLNDGTGKVETGTAPYSFVGWATSADGAKVYDNNQSVKSLANTQGAKIHLYAKWKSEPVELPVVTRTGYTFSKWSECDVLINDTNTYKSGDTSNGDNDFKQYTIEGPFAENDVFVMECDASCSGVFYNFFYGQTNYLNVKEILNSEGVKSGSVNGNNRIPESDDFKHYTVKFTLGNSGDGSVKKYLLFRAVKGSTCSVKNIVFRKINTGSSITGTTFSNLTPASGNTINLEAIWEPITYTVSYNGNGSTGGSTASSTHTYDLLKALTTNGYSKSYTVTYNANGGECKPANEQASYTFAGWAKESGGAAVYSNAQQVRNLASTQNANVTLYAKWSGGTVTLPEPTRMGYTFTGWYDAATGGNKIGDAGNTYTVTASRTIYAHWIKNPYTVIFDNNGGTGSISNQLFEFDVAQNLTKNNNAITRTGYTFSGWTGYQILIDDKNTYSYDNTDGSAYKDIVEYTIPGPFSENEVYVMECDAKSSGTGAFMNYFYGKSGYLQIKSVQVGDNVRTASVNDGNNVITRTSDYSHYKVTFTMGSEGNGNVAKILLFRANEGANCSVKNIEFKKPVSFSDNQSVKNLTTIKNGTVTLYAKWTPNTYTITYNGNNNSEGSVASSKHTYDEAKQVTANSFKKEYTVTFNANGGECSTTSAKASYTFDGWKVTSGLNTSTAKWGIDNKTSDSVSGSTLISDGAYVKNLNADVNGAVTLTAQWKQGGVVLPKPTKTGYRFAGWYTAEETTENPDRMDGKTYNPNSEVTLIAKWVEIIYYVSYDGNGSTSGEMTKSLHSFNTASPLKSNAFAKVDVVTYNANGGSVVTTDENTKSTNEFAGWTVESGLNSELAQYGTKDSYENKFNGSTVLSNGAYIYNLSAEDESIVALKAKWYSGTVKLPDATKTTKRGYSFAGWFTDKGLTNSAGTTTYSTSSDKELFAKWDPRTYTIALDNNGATTPGTTSIFEKFETGFFLDSECKKTMTTESNGITIPEKTGYNFKGYYTGVNGEGKQFIDGNGKLTSDAVLTQFADGDTLKLYASWEAKKFKVTFNGHGEDVYVKDTSTAFTSLESTVTYDSTYGEGTAEFPVIERTGYIFNGWYSTAYVDGNAPDETVEKFTSGKIVKILDDTTLYASWTPITYTIKFEGMDKLNAAFGTKYPTDYTIKYGTSFTLSIPSRDYSAFLGWELSNANGNESKYGKTAKFHLGDDHIVTADNGVAYGADKEITFWNLTPVQNAEVVLKATWRTSKSTLIVDPNGGTFTTSTSFEYTVDEDGIWTFADIEYADTLTIPEPERDGYVFDGWELTGDKNGTFDRELEKYTFGPVDKKVDRLTAKWKVFPSDLHLDTNGGYTNENILYFNGGGANVSYDTYDINGLKLNASYEADGDMTLSGSVSEVNKEFKSDKFLRVYLEQSESYVLSYKTNNPNGIMFMYTKDLEDTHYVVLEPLASKGDIIVDNGDGTYTYYIYITPDEIKNSGRVNTFSSVVLPDPEEIPNELTNEYRISYVLTGENVSEDYEVTDINMKKLNNLVEEAQPIGTVVGDITTLKDIKFTIGKGNDGTYKLTDGKNKAGKVCSISDKFVKFAADKKKNYVLTYTSTNDTTVFGFSSVNKLNPDTENGDFIVNNGDGTYSYAVHFSPGVLGVDLDGYCYLNLYMGNKSTDFTEFEVSDIKIVEEEEYMVITQLMDSRRYLVDPIKLGYHITGWNSIEGDGKLDGKTYKYSFDKSVVQAQWEQNTYNLSYVLDDRIVNPDDYDPAEPYGAATIVDYDEEFVVAAPERTGYEFKGWKIEDVGANAFYLDESDPKDPVWVKMTKGDNEFGNLESITFKNLTDVNKATVKFTAVWEANNYTVKFNGNNSTGIIGVTGGNMADQTFAYGERKALSENKYVRSHTVTYDYDYNGFITPVTATGVFEGWSLSPNAEVEYADKAEVKNLAVGSDVEPVRTLYAVWNFDFTLPDYTRTGYYLEGWYLAGNIRVGGPGDPYVPENNVTLTAKWKANNYYLAFHGNGATEGYMGSTYSLPSGDVHEAQKMTFGTPDYIISNAYAKNYTVTLNYNDESQTPDSNIKATCAFKEWNTEQAGSGVSYTNNQYIEESLTSVKDSVIDLYAQWEEGVAELPEPSREGYIFKGWSISKDDTTDLKEAGTLFYTTTNTTLYAHWEPATNNITFETGDGDYNYFNPYLGNTDNNGLTYTGNNDGTITINGINNIKENHLITIPFSPQNGETYSIAVDHISGEADKGSLKIGLKKHLNNNVDPVQIVKGGTIELNNSNDFTTSSATWTFSSSGIKGSDIQGFALYYDSKDAKVNNLKLRITITKTAPVLESIDVAPGDRLPSITVPTRTGFTFLGFYDAVIDGNQYYNEKGEGTVWDKREDTKLYAHWSSEKYTIKFNVDISVTGSQKEPYTQTVYVGKETALDEVRFVAAGFYFDYWSYNFNGKDYKLINGQKVKDLTGAGQTIELRTHWNTFHTEGDWQIARTYDFTQATNVELFKANDKIPGDAKLNVSAGLSVSADKAKFGEELTYSQLAAPNDFSNVNFDVKIVEDTFIVTFIPGSKCNAIVEFYFELSYQGKYYTGKVLMYPASVVLYEETSFNENDSVNGADNNDGASWYSEGTSKLVISRETSNRFGYSADIRALGCGDYSGGTVSKTILNKNVNVSTTKEFQFNGNGFDLISACGPDTAAMVIYVWSYDQTSQIYNPVAITTVDTYIEAGSDLLNGNNLLTQAPIYHFMSTDNTQYLVQVYAVYLDDSYETSNEDNLTLSVAEDLQSKGFDIDESIFSVQWMDDNSVFNGGTGAEPVIAVTSTDGSGENLLTSRAPVLTGYLDGIRVYKPGGNVDPAVYDNVKVEDQITEKNATFYNIYQYSSGVEASSSMNTGSMASFANEVYLRPGESVNVMIGDLDINPDGSKRPTFINGKLNPNIRVMVSFRTVKGSPVINVVGGLKLYYDNAYTAGTELYYDISDAISSNGLLKFKNMSDSPAGSILAICNVKITYNGEVTSNFISNTGLLTMSPEDIQNANTFFENVVNDEYKFIGSVASYDNSIEEEEEEKPEIKEPGEISIDNYNKYNGKSVDYRSTIKFTASVKNCDGSAIIWYVDGVEAGRGSKFTLSEITKDVKIYCQSTDNLGNTVTSQTETIKTSGGFFKVITAFFKGLFGNLPILVQ